MGKKKTDGEDNGFTIAIRFEGKSLEDLKILQGMMSAPSLESVLKSVMDVGLTTLLMSASGDFDQFIFRNSKENKIAFIDDLLKSKIPNMVPIHDAPKEETAKAKNKPSPKAKPKKGKK